MVPPGPSRVIGRLSTQRQGEKRAGYTVWASKKGSEPVQVSGRQHWQEFADLPVPGLSRYPDGPKNWQGVPFLTGDDSLVDSPKRTEKGTRGKVPFLTGDDSLVDSPKRTEKGTRGKVSQATPLLGRGGVCASHRRFPPARDPLSR
ncbi:hypothetical protein NDU88_006708 [Pleurodeles waltl]|uniref:Uncharacterized protein n=1 Tax=Pleurodeles waltl TaxID=8319 RepID=A0AAV7QPQ2_PLEWA|nr:hypothetical protein NDU88_006708 [Pleurodeles waltl]